MANESEKMNGYLYQLFHYMVCLLVGYSASHVSLECAVGLAAGCALFIATEKISFNRSALADARGEGK